MHAVDDELRGILTKRDAEVLGRALPRIHAYFDQDDQVQVPSVRSRRALADAESIEEIEEEAEVSSGR